MGKLLRNLLITSKREKKIFLTENNQECDFLKSVEAISDFVSHLINIGSIWNSETKTRNLLLSALKFYEIVSLI